LKIEGHVDFSSLSDVVLQIALAETGRRRPGGRRRPISAAPVSPSRCNGLPKLGVAGS
jgi:hypothetical protein